MRRLMAGTTPQIWLIFIGYSKSIEPVGDVRICLKKQRSGFGTMEPSDDCPVDRHAFRDIERIGTSVANAEILSRTHRIRLVAA